MVTYEYHNIELSIDLCCIHDGVMASTMTDKDIKYCRWDEATEILKVIFYNILSGDDKIKLDTIVSTNT